MNISGSGSANTEREGEVPETQRSIMNAGSTLPAEAHANRQWHSSSYTVTPAVVTVQLQSRLFPRPVPYFSPAILLRLEFFARYQEEDSTGVGCSSTTPGPHCTTWSPPSFSVRGQCAFYKLEKNYKETRKFYAAMEILPTQLIDVYSLFGKLRKSEPTMSVGRER